MVCLCKLFYNVPRFGMLYKATFYRPHSWPPRTSYLYLVPDGVGPLKHYKHNHRKQTLFIKLVQCSQYHLVGYSCNYIFQLKNCDCVFNFNNTLSHKKSAEIYRQFHKKWLCFLQFYQQRSS